MEITIVYWDICAQPLETARSLAPSLSAHKGQQIDSNSGMLHDVMARLSGTGFNILIQRQASAYTTPPT